MIGARLCHLIVTEKFASSNREQSKESVQGKTRRRDAGEETAIDEKYFFSLIDRLQANKPKGGPVRLRTSFTSCLIEVSIEPQSP